MSTAPAVIESLIPDRSTLLARARALVPVVAARADRCQAEKRVPHETIEDFKRAGFFRILQPRRWGGYELDPRALYDVQMTIAEADMSSAWVLGVLAAHNLQLALLDDRAQQDVWGSSDQVLISSSYQPVGTVERVTGGFRLSGHWGYSSGCHHCDWIFLGAMVPPAPEHRTFLLPKSDYRIVAAWDVFGLEGTGSEDIIVENAFVPEYRTHRGLDGFRGTNPGRVVNDGPLYRLPWAQVFVRSVSTSCIGAAQGALHAFLDIARSRVSTNTGKASKADPFALAAAASAQAEIDKLKLVIEHNFGRMMSLAAQGREIPYEERVRYRYDSQTVATTCAAIVDGLMPLLGGKALYRKSPIVRKWLDVCAARAHVACDANLIGLPLGQLMIGGEAKETFV